MTPMTREQREIADRERPGAVCGRAHEGGCSGRLNVSHPYGRRIQERWMWFWCCERHHTGDLKNTKKDKYMVLLQGNEEDFSKYPKAAPNWRQDKEYFLRLYGKAK